MTKHHSLQGGFEATAKIREYERNLGGQRTPIIALTAHAMMGDRERCIQAQMDEYLSKPLQQNQLLQTILKCATLGGELLEKNRERELARAADAASGNRHGVVYQDDGANPVATQNLIRPRLTTRAITTARTFASPPGPESQASTNVEDTLDVRMPVSRSSLSEPNIHKVRG